MTFFCTRKKPRVVSIFLFDTVLIVKGYKPRIFSILYNCYVNLLFNAYYCNKIIKKIFVFANYSQSCSQFKQQTEYLFRNFDFLVAFWASAINMQNHTCFLIGCFQVTCKRNIGICLLLRL